MHLLSGDVTPEERVSAAVAAEEDASDRIRELEDAVGALRRELETLREQFAAFQKQFQ
jgi:uncharacterized protein YceH (UPF0502 family)